MSPYANISTGNAAVFVFDVFVVACQILNELKCPAAVIYCNKSLKRLHTISVVFTTTAGTLVVSRAYSALSDSKSERSCVSVFPLYYH